MMSEGLGKSGKLTNETRHALALGSLSWASSIAALAKAHGVSRQTVHTQQTKARQAVKAAFVPDANDEAVLFYLPVTSRWLWQFIVALTFICRGSYRAVAECARDLLGVPMSIGYVHAVLHSLSSCAGGINRGQDLSPITGGAADEIFHGSKPVLACVDARTTYCYCLTTAERRDGDTWGVHLLDLRDQGLEPDYIVADAGSGIRSGHRMAWNGEKPCHGDVFHILHQMETLTNLQARMEKGKQTALAKLQAKASSGTASETLAVQLSVAVCEADQAKALVKALRLLTKWMQRDILSLAGPCLAVRQELFDFLVDELEQLAPLDEPRIRPLCTALKNQRDDLLAFAGVIDKKLADLAKRHRLPKERVREICLLHRLPETCPSYWMKLDHLRRAVGINFETVLADVARVLAETPRSSSLVESLNARLRICFTLRRHIDDQYLGLLQFFINHRRFTRSRCPERAGKSPRELMTGQAHPHWMTMLGLGSLQPMALTRAPSFAIAA
jgi:hypothetical protein